MPATSAPDAPAAPDADTVVTITVENGKVQGGVTTHPVKLGSSLAIVVTADVTDSVHFHGYDIEEDIAPGKPATITATADIPGVFEVELEDRGLKLAELEVK